MFAWQLLAREVSRARTMFGVAIARRIPMIRTAIMISIRVKPRRDFLLSFVFIFSFLSRTAPPRSNRRGFVYCRRLPVDARGVPDGQLVEARKVRGGV